MAICWPLQMSPTEKSVLISLADNANDSGFCWPSIAYMCERTCLSKATVIRAIAGLERLGLLYANRSNGRHTTYTLTVDGKQQPVSQSNRCQPDTGITVSTNRYHSEYKPVSQRDTNRHRTVIEPSKEKSQPPDGGIGSNSGSPPDDYEDPIKAIFDQGVRILTAAGKSEQGARSLIGRLRKTVGDEDFARILVASRSASDPAAYMVKAAQPKIRAVAL